MVCCSWRVMGANRMRSLSECYRRFGLKVRSRRQNVAIVATRPLTQPDQYYPGIADREAQTSRCPRHMHHAE